MKKEPPYLQQATSFLNTIIFVIAFFFLKGETYILSNNNSIGKLIIDPFSFSNLDWVVFIKLFSARKKKSASSCMFHFQGNEYRKIDFF